MQRDTGTIIKVDLLDKTAPGKEEDSFRSGSIRGKSLMALRR
jgi:hypothetical protein